MKKRLRKKKHHGEFAEWGRQIVITRNRKEGIDDFLDAFGEEAIEANGCYCGGGGTDEKLDFVVELGPNSADPEAKLERIVAWLRARNDVQEFKIGELFDVWHGDFEDIEERVEEAGPADN
jgi:uncharacterized protein YggL (DUF469 family)